MGRTILFAFLLLPWAISAAFQTPRRLGQPDPGLALGPMTFRLPSEVFGQRAFAVLHQARFHEVTIADRSVVEQSPRVPKDDRQDACPANASHYCLTAHSYQEEGWLRHPSLSRIHLTAYLNTNEFSGSISPS